MEEKSVKKVITNLDSGMASPIPVNEETVNSEINKMEEILKKEENIIANNNEDINNLVRKVEVRYSSKTIVIMILILIALVFIFVVFELPMLRGL